MRCCVRRPRAPTVGLSENGARRTARSDSASGLLAATTLAPGRRCAVTLPLEPNGARGHDGEEAAMQLNDMVMVSVDDHVVEPPHLFDGRLPAKYADLAPKFVT